MKRPIFVSPIIVDVIFNAVSGVTGVKFVDHDRCPSCSGLLVSHDIKKRRFSTIYGKNGPEDVNVFVKRFHCRECNRLCYASAPFYDQSRFGSPIVDLCITLSSDHTFSHTARLMNQFGIVIDRGTVRKIAGSYHHPVPSADLLGIRIPQSVIALSTLVTRSDPSDIIPGRAVMEACGFHKAESSDIFRIQ